MDRYFDTNNLFNETKHGFVSYFVINIRLVQYVYLYI